VAPREGYWFPAKRYGWGWGLPRRWQGWAVLTAFAGLLVVAVRFVRPHQHPLAFAGLVVLLTAVLLAVCWRKGEPPRWRWGND
jgi:hypothetical protein